MRSSIGVVGAFAVMLVVPGNGRAAEGARPAPEPEVVLRVTCPSDAVRAAVERRRPEVVACYEQELASRPRLSATSVFEWTVEADGRVTAPTSNGMSAEYEDPALRDCVLARIARWTFPRPGGRVAVTMVAGFSTKRPPAAAGDEAAGGGASIDTVAVRKVIQAHQKEILACYQARLEQDPKLAGKVVMRWSITAAGGVQNVQVADGTTLEDHALHECMRARIATWRFAPSSEEAVSNVTYPWVFRASP